jgi:hypothetical protein
MIDVYATAGTFTDKHQLAALDRRRQLAVERLTIVGMVNDHVHGCFRSTGYPATARVR